MENTFNITTTAYNEVVKKIGSQKAEQGGVLMGKDGIITDFIHDRDARTTGGTYELNIAYLNPLIKKRVAQGKEFLGIVHSHPIGYSSLSPQDKKYFKSQFKNFEHLETMYTPIVYSARDGEFHFYPYVFHKSGTITDAKLEILPDNYEAFLTPKATQNPAKKEIVETQTEVIKTEKEVTINFHNTVTQKGRLEPITIYTEKKQEEEKTEDFEQREHEVLAESTATILDENTTKVFPFSTIYHAFLSIFILIVLGLIISLLPTFYKYISQTLLN